MHPVCKESNTFFNILRLQNHFSNYAVSSKYANVDFQVVIEKKSNFFQYNGNYKHIILEIFNQLNISIDTCAVQHKDNSVGIILFSFLGKKSINHRLLSLWKRLLLDNMIKITTNIGLDRCDLFWGPRQVGDVCFKGHEKMFKC